MMCQCRRSTTRRATSNCRHNRTRPLRQAMGLMTRLTMLALLLAVAQVLTLTRDSLIAKAGCLGMASLTRAFLSACYRTESGSDRMLALDCGLKVQRIAGLNVASGR